MAANHAKHNVSPQTNLDGAQSSPHIDGRNDLVTDRSLVLQAMANNVGPRDAVVADVMSEGLATAGASAVAFEALQVMRVKGMRHLAASAAAGLPLGTVSLDDVIAGLGAEMGSLTDMLAKEMKSVCELGRRGPRW